MWKLKVNVNKTKIMVFRSGGILRRNLSFLYERKQIEIVQKFTYLGLIFTTGDSFSETFELLAGQARKAMFNLNKCLHWFTQITPKHYLCLINWFNRRYIMDQKCGDFQMKLFWKGFMYKYINRCNPKRLVRLDLKSERLVTIMKYWFKILLCENTKYIKCVYNMSWCWTI